MGKGAGKGAQNPAMMAFKRHPEEYPVPDPKDATTPDAWVKRAPELVRLTGRHPFNVEPPLPMLIAHGHSTPASLHYVRNHGKVPVVYSDATADQVERDWRCELLSGHGVTKSASLSLEDLKALPKSLSRRPSRRVDGVSASKAGGRARVDAVATTAASIGDVAQVARKVLLVCAGNRRKEQNMVKRTIGFNWGAAGLGMSEWGGCHLADVLAAHGVSTDPATWDDGRHVCFRGPDKELPAGADGSYGTSLPLRYVMDKSNDVILCWEQNGLRLQADHGFPLRIIIPGFIGGRMVKWLKEIKVSDQCSDNHYHFKDNRVLPVNVTPEQAEAEGWWFKPDYIINELNINSAISSPGHGEVLKLNECGPTYDVKGYAYGGGGRKIIRVEVTLDGGKSWHLVEDGNVTHPPGTPTAAGKYWGWCMWTITVPTSDLLKATNVACRAWDAAMNTQPKELTWNVMGMLNNPWFTVVKHFDYSEDGPVLTFEHPTLAGQQTGGWMTPDARRLAGAHLSEESAYAQAKRDMHAARAAAIEASAGPDEKVKDEPVAVKPGVPSTVFTLADLEKHDSETDCWIAVNGVVYDTNPYLTEHPGGAQSITMNAGQEVTEEFTAIHSRKAWALLDKYAIGTLKTDGASVKTVEASDSLVALNKKKRASFVLEKKEQLSSDSFRLRFALPSKEHTLGLPVGQHVLVYGKDKDEKMVARAYTPTTADEVKGHVDFVIKAYRPLPPRFPDGGALSQYLCDRIKEGDSVEFRGPIGEITYLGNGIFDATDKDHKPMRFKCSKAGLIAGGTGITPMLQLCTAAAAEAAKGNDQHPQYSLLLGNRTTNDILCKPELEQAEAAGVVALHYTLDKPPADWPHFTGFVDAPMLEKTMPPPGPDTYIFCCGPPPMIKSAIAKLEALGHDPSHVLCF